MPWKGMQVGQLLGLPLSELQRKQSWDSHKHRSQLSALWEWTFSIPIRGSSSVLTGIRRVCSVLKCSLKSRCYRNAAKALWGVADWKSFSALVTVKSATVTMHLRVFAQFSRDWFQRGFLTSCQERGYFSDKTSLRRPQVAQEVRSHQMPPVVAV